MRMRRAVAEMKQHELNAVLETLIAQWENEVIEFKGAEGDFNTDRIGRYFSALANEANLADLECAWLVFGVENRTRRVSGTEYRIESDRLNGLKQQITADTNPPISFRNIHVLAREEKRVILFEIPAAPQGIPIAWKGHYYARSGESLTAMGLDKLDQIRGQMQRADWSAQLVPEATLRDLDEGALQKAREAFANKHANRFSGGEVSAWTDAAFLDRARLTVNGQMTRTALLLLGKPEAAYYLSPHPAQMTWRLETSERAYEHFAPPFFLNTTELFRRIRNVQIRIQPENTLLPVEVAKYDRKVILEALHNCVAHQDYTRNGRIIVSEYQDRLTFENEGEFFEREPKDYILGQRTPHRYRNHFLVTAMVELNMIDQMGYGIHEIYLSQAKRYFPLPDYKLDANHVSLTIYGSVFDEGYSRILIQKTDLPLQDILLLDMVQKNHTIPEKAISHLRKSGWIEGRKGTLRFSEKIATAIDQVDDYILTRAQDNVFYKKQIIDFLTIRGTASRKQIDRLLLKQFSKVLSAEQKDKKVGTLLTSLRRKGVIINTRSRKDASWALVKKNAEKK